jgi:hypothetical protein
MRFTLTLLIAACATSSPPPPKGGPRGLRADEHVAMAHHHDEIARQSTSIPDRRSGPETVGVPWFRSWNFTAEHERLAAVHRSKAGQLQAAYEEACGTRPLAEVSISPLVRYGVGGWNTSTGVILYLSPDAGPADRLLADVKCHRAWMMLEPAANMDDCPLDLPGLQLDARGDRDGITVSIVVLDPKLVDELHRRAAHDLESGARLRKPTQ